MQLIELGEKPIQTVIMLNDRKKKLKNYLDAYVKQYYIWGGGWFLRFEKKNL